MKIYVTKYALSKGILEYEAEEHDARWPKMAVVPGASGTYRQTFHGEGKDWHRTREAAIERAEIMRKDRIESIRKSIVKLTALKFE